MHSFFYGFLFLGRHTMKRWAAFATVGLLVPSLSGCANHNASSASYTYGQAQREQIIRRGTVTGVRPVTIQTDASTGAGVLGGGVLGGVLGGSIGGGSGRSITTVGGALLGALAGNAIENRASMTSGLEITVHLDNGEVRAITQAADIPLTVGQRVKIISGAGPTRVAPLTEPDPGRGASH